MYQAGEPARRVRSSSMDLMSILIVLLIICAIVWLVQKMR